MLFTAEPSFQAYPFPSHNSQCQQLLHPALSSLGKHLHLLFISLLNGCELSPGPRGQTPVSESSHLSASVPSACPLLSLNKDFKMPCPLVPSMITYSSYVFPWSHGPYHVDLSRHLCCEFCSPLSLPGRAVPIFMSVVKPSLTLKITKVLLHCSLLLYNTTVYYASSRDKDDPHIRLT